MSNWQDDPEIQAAALEGFVGNPVAVAYANAQAAAALIFRSRSGRTEVTRLPDGSLDLRVLKGQDVLDADDVGRLIDAI